jgi:hypothetical protein
MSAGGVASSLSRRASALAALAAWAIVAAPACAQFSVHRPKQRQAAPAPIVAPAPKLARKEPAARPSPAAKRARRPTPRSDRHGVAKQPPAPAAPLEARPSGAAVKAGAAQGRPPPGRFAVINRNSSVLLALRLGDGLSDDKVVAGGVAPGQRILAPLPVEGRCKYDVHASFEDWSIVEARDVDLCADPILAID